MDLTTIFEKIDKIVSKAELGKKKAENLKEALNSIGNIDTFSNELKLALVNSYDDVRAITVDVCNDVKSFDISIISNVLKDGNKLNNFKANKENIEMKCSFVLSEQDIKDFKENLENLSKVFSNKDSRLNIISSIASLTDKHIEIHNTTKEVFTNLKKDIQESIEK